MMAEQMSRIITYNGMELFKLYPDDETIYVNPEHIVAMVPRTIKEIVHEDQRVETLDEPVDALTLVLVGAIEPVVVLAPKAS